MLDAFVAVLTTLLIAVTLPDRARCEPGWSLHEGVRLDGSYACYGPLKPPGCGDAAGDWKPCQKPEIKRSRVYCTNGHRPIVVDERTVGCQARR
jgi:hypothetical protein